MSTGESLELFAVAAPGLEPVVDGELRGMGIRGEAEPGGIRWIGSLADVYRANLHLRTASRVLVRVARFRARSFIELERHARRIDWTAYLAAGDEARLRITSRKSKLYHEGAIEERFARFIGERSGAAVWRSGRDVVEDDEAKDAGAKHAGVGEDLMEGDGAVGDGTGEDGGAGTEHDNRSGTPDRVQRFVVRFHRDECVVSADSSGELLHRRGYRQAVAKAPIRENLAATMLLASGWTGEAPLLDPLCGSGTIPIEGALLGRRIPPGLANPDRVPRSYTFERWGRFEPAVWEGIVDAARTRIRPAAEVPIQGSDRDAGAIEAARSNAARAGVEADIEFSARALSAIEPARGSGWLVANPPYGVRVGDPRPLRDLYAALGNLARGPLAGWTIALLAADDQLGRQLGITLTEVLRTRNGGIPVTLLTGSAAAGGDALPG
jgi:putative N6-adenine-specific DNA methylase